MGLALSETNSTGLFPSPLLTAAEAGNATPGQREEWINTARSILKNETEDQLAARSPSDRLSLAAASYGFWSQHLGNPDLSKNSWEDLAAMTKKLPDNEKQKLTDDLALQAKALKGLSLPDEYFRLEDRIHKRAYEIFSSDPENLETMTAWGKTAAENFIDQNTGMIRPDMTKTDGTGQVMTADARQILDGAGVTRDKVIKVMNAASSAMNQAWTEEAARQGIKDASQPMQVGAATAAERQFDFNALTDKSGGAYYKVNDMNAALLDPRDAMHAAFHEPHHQIQDRIAGLLKQGAPLPDYMRQSSAIFKMPEDFRVDNCPPGVLAVNKRAEKLADECYDLNRAEESGLYQGNRAVVEINRQFMPGAPPKTELIEKQSPQLVRALAQENRDQTEGNAGIRQQAPSLPPVQPENDEGNLQTAILVENDWLTRISLRAPALGNTFQTAVFGRPAEQNIPINKLPSPAVVNLPMASAPDFG